jgi:hypothetical protein
VFAMEATAESGAGDDWLAGAMIEFGGEITERVDVPLEGLEFGSEAEEAVS